MKWALKLGWLKRIIGSCTPYTAVDIICYDPGYTFVEKLQTAATKYRQEQTDGIVRKNYMRQYYDLHCLLKTEQVQDFIKTEAYQVQKKARFPKADYAIPISENEAFLLSDPVHTLNK